MTFGRKSDEGVCVAVVQMDGGCSWGHGALVWSALTVVVHEHRHVVVVVAKRVLELISDEPHADKAAHLPPHAHTRKRLGFASRLASGGTR